MRKLPEPSLHSVNESSYRFTFPRLRSQQHWKDLEVGEYNFYLLYNPTNQKDTQHCVPVSDDAQFVCQRRIPARLDTPASDASQFTVIFDRGSFPAGLGKNYGFR